MTKEPIDFFDAEGNRIGTLDASAPLVMDWQRGSVPVGGDGCSAVSKETRPFEFRSPGNKREHMNEFNPDWDQMAVLVEHSQEQAAKIDALEKQLAEQATTYIEPTSNSGEGWIFDKEKFADLIRADEREACAKLVDFILKEGGGTWGDAIRARKTHD